MAHDVIATRSLWGAVRANDSKAILALLKKGANVRARGQSRVIGDHGTRVGRDTLLDEAFKAQALDSLRVLLNNGAALSPHPDNGSEFTRACATATPWMEGVTLLMELRPKLTALAHPSRGYKPIHEALLHTGPLTDDPAVITHPLVDLLLTRPGKWQPGDTALAVRLCLKEGKDPGLLERLEAAGVPVAQHLASDQPEARAMVWKDASLRLMSLPRWQTWWNALDARGVTPTPDLDPAFLAAHRQHQGQQAAPERLPRRRLRS